jgi:hypothetical protein
MSMYVWMHVYIYAYECIYLGLRIYIFMYIYIYIYGGDVCIHAYMHIRTEVAQSVWGWAAVWTTGVRFLAGKEIFLYSMASKQALGPTQPLVQWVPGLFPGGKAVGT